MSKADRQKKQLEKKTLKMKEMLDSYPDPIDVDGGKRPDITTSKLVYILLEHSQGLNKLTKSLIALTVMLVIVTLVDIIFRVVL